MATFQDLPDEILLHILSVLELEKATLATLALVNKHLHALSRRFIYNSLQLDSITRTKPIQDRYQHLISTLRSDSLPSPLPPTTSLTLHWHRCGEAFYINSLLRYLHNLQTLNISIATKAVDFNADFFRFNGLASLTTVTLDVLRLSALTVAQFLALPKIKEVRVEGFDDMMSLDGVFAEQEMPWKYIPSETLERLEFNLERCSITSETLSLLLPNPAPNLKTLAIPFPCLSRKLEYRKYRNMTEPFSPRKIGKLIQVFGAGVEELRIGCENLRGAMHDSSRLDLRAIEGLKRVHVPAKLLFMDSVADEGRKGVWWYLPRSLEVLEVDFTANFRLLSHRPFNDRERIDPRKLNWITELAINKPRYLPSLSRILVRERVRPNPLTSRSIQVKYPVLLTPLPPPREVTTIFTEKKINLEILIRTQKQGGQCRGKKRGIWMLEDFKCWENVGPRRWEEWPVVRKCKKVEDLRIEGVGKDEVLGGEKEGEMMGRRNTI